MGDKIKFVGMIILVEFFIYFFITAIWGSVMVPAIDVAYVGTDNATMPYSKAFIGSVPIWLYILPGAIGVGAIVWKLRMAEKP